MGAVLFSSKAIVVKLAYDHHVGADTLLALRMGCSLPVYLVLGGMTVLRRRARGEALPDRRQWLGALVVGMVGYWLASYMDFMGLVYISASFERLILFTYPLFVVILGWAFFGQRMTWGVWPSFALSYGGLAVVYSAYEGERGTNLVVGALCVLVAALSFGLYQLLAKPRITKMGSDLFTAVAMTGATLGALLMFFAGHSVGELHVVEEIWPHAAFLAIGATVIPSYFLNAALARISAKANAVIGMISPVATIFLAALILGENLTLREGLGATLVVGGIACFVWLERRGT